MEFSNGATATTTAANSTRAGTPESDPIERVQRPNPFTTPYGSMPASTIGSTTGLETVQPNRFFHSRRIKKEDVEKPWLDKKDPKQKWTWIIPLIGIFIGLGLSGFVIYDGLQTVENYTYCPVFLDDFSNGLGDQWTKEVESGGYGNGQFEVTTNTDENVYVQDGMLHIKPTLQDQSLIENDNVVNLLQDGICSSDIWSNCVAVTNTTNGTIINPVKSGRVSTRLSHSIKFGRIEVEAQLPEGDWMWPAIWMLPVNNTYGDWPASGEIDIMESRGNNYTYPLGGNNIVSSTLHWGPDPLNDAYWQNIGKNKALQTTYTKGFHTFGLEWSEKYLFTYVDSRLQQVTYTTFKKPFWQKGRFPSSDANGTRIVDPWSQTGRHSTPFDQDFYLILNVAVGGTNGWFEDGMKAKPWVDTSDTAPKDFWNARDQWYPTWQDKGQMIVKSVKMWQQKGFNGCE